jgi:hypothetical protein
MARQLLEAILDNGVPNPNYFDGRLLTATALREDQDAHRSRQRHLGRAVGAGIVEGLWVTIDFAGSATAAPRLAVGSGLAINSSGHSLELPGDEIVALARTTTPGAAGTGLFQTCEPPTSRVEAPGDGFYVLVLSPASGFRGRAPLSGLSDPTAGPGCGSRWAMEGVRLRIEAVDPVAVSGVSSPTRQLLTQLLGSGSDSDLSQLRNVVAHLCLGTESLVTFATDPFARDTLPGGGTEPAFLNYGAIDDLIAAGRLTDCDVPLALLLWRGPNVLFVDNWAVRRRVAQAPTALAWPTLTGGRRRAESEAVLFQFQDQLASIVERLSNPTAVRARDYFHWLPAAGLLPLVGGGRARGVDALTFFDGLTAREAVFLEGARMPALVGASLHYPPVDLTSGEMLWRYLLRENRLNPTGTPPLLLFAGGHVPYMADPQFDLSHWNFANFGPGVAG